MVNSLTTRLKSVPTIAIVVAHTANVRLLESVLGGYYQLVFGIEALSEQPIDLIIADTALFRRHANLIADLRESSKPLVLPVLLVHDPKTGGLKGPTAILGNMAEDIIKVPVTRQELTARVGNLVRLRMLSSDQEIARAKLDDMLWALQLLNACDEILVRINEKFELLQTLCETIVEYGYPVAWVCFCPTEPGDPISILASAGIIDEQVSDLVTDWRANEPKIVDDLNTHAQLMPGHQTVALQGVLSAIFLPLKDADRGRVVLGIYSFKNGYFSKTEARPLERLANNLDYALKNIQLQRQQELKTQEIKALAFTDALTGLPNRRYLINFLEEIFTQSISEVAPSVAILFVDLDGFKRINDTLGHDVGDIILIDVSKRLLHALRETDLVIRHGGDEFLVVMHDAPREESPLVQSSREQLTEAAKYLSDRIIQQLSRPFSIAGRNHLLSASIGISLCPEHGEEAGTIIRAADTAMYIAKSKGGGQSQLYSIELSDKNT